MTVISVSLTSDLLDKLDELLQTGNYDLVVFIPMLEIRDVWHLYTEHGDVVQLTDGDRPEQFGTAHCMHCSRKLRRWQQRLRDCILGDHIPRRH